MASRAIGSVIFLGLFGIVFIVAGVRRLLSMRGSANKRESLVWGTIGVLIGFGFLYGTFWLMTPPDPKEEQEIFVRQAAIEGAGFYAALVLGLR